MKPHSQPKPTPVDVHSADTATKVLPVFFRICEAWDLSSSEQQTLLGVGKSTLALWRAGKVKAGLDRTVLERLSYVFGIYSALQILLPIPERADAWVRRANSAPLFGGTSALQRMLGGQVADLLAVHAYLNAQRGGDFA
ncbi:MAG TPA: MbcA/ParS/Xre antitoxin family protein [Burkholderiaceae bacterium]|nr:MbcA/ParS/Xre antitoxin family protein [Burkholderiaceae bacterium]